MARRTIERRRRGFFGWIFVLMFWGWNAVMAISMFGGLAGTADRQAQLATEAERAGHAIGMGIGVMALLLMWALGAVILGLLAYFTAGRREMIEVDA